MDAAHVLEMLANSDARLSDGLRSATLLQEVRNDDELLAWIQSEVSGWSAEDVPDYRIRTLQTVGDASNPAWRHAGATIPINTFSEQIRTYAGRPILFVQGVGTLEDLMASPDASFQMPWDPGAAARLNWEIQEGGTGINQTYRVENVHHDVPRSIIRELLEYVRHRALTEVAKRVRQQPLDATPADTLPTGPSHVAVQGSGNQIIVGSPGASATFAVNVGDRIALDEALSSMGIDQQRITELHEAIDDPKVDQPSKVMRALDWCRTTAKELGVNTAGSAAATLILEYLGHL